MRTILPQLQKATVIGEELISQIRFYPDTDMHILLGGMKTEMFDISRVTTHLIYGDD